MNAASYAFAMLFYLAVLVMAAGLATRILTYWRTPAPLKIPTTPAPVTSAGVGFRMAREILLFESLFKSNLWIWGLGWVFHVALALVLARHLRYFTEPIWPWVTLLQPFGIYAGFAMVAGVLGLWARRIFVERIRYISTISDHLMLVLLVGIASSGLGMRFIAHTDVIGVKLFFVGLMRADLHPLPGDGLLYVPPRARGRADDHISVQQAAACAGNILLADTQSGG